MRGFIYNLLLTPLLPLAYLWRVLAAGRSSGGWRESLGGLPKYSDRETSRQLIWIHAASVGEVVASVPLIDELRLLRPDTLIVLTTMTYNGNTMARKSARSADVIAHLPLDYPPFMNRALNRLRPDAIVIMEAEMWPNMLSAARRRGIPVALANGRVTDSSLRYPYSRWLKSWVVTNIDHMCMQTETDAKRIKGFGAHPESVHVFGSLKFDQEGGELPEDTVSALKDDLSLPHGIPLFVAGSTNPGEDEPVLSAFTEVRKTVSDLRLIIAPRQVDRGDEIQSLAESRGFTCARRSSKDPYPAEYDVLILDTFGELASVYAVGEVTFVGGSLIPKGGHSLFQPILQGKPVLFGPHIFKTRDMAQMAIEAGVGFEVKDAHEMAERILALLADDERRAGILSACRKLVAENRGASGRCARLIVDLMADRSQR